MRRAFLVLVSLAVLILGGGAVWWFSQGSEAPSTGITAPPADEATTTTATATDSEPGEGSGGRVTYALTEESRASFTIDEELRGTPTTVVGTSSIVLGEILVDPHDPASIAIGTILINARDFTTDSGNRNRAIRGPILDADTFEFIEFAPTAIEGFGGGPEASFTITGDLSIRGVAHPVTFDVVARLDAEIIRGTATAVVDRTQWGLNIPNAPGVANVSESVTLTLEFEAAPTS